MKKNKTENFQTTGDLFIHGNGNIQVSSGVIMDRNSVTVDGETFIIPEHVKKKFGNSTSIVDKKVTVNGYKLNIRTGEWKTPMDKIFAGIIKRYRK